MFATVYALFYGKFIGLHQRLIDSLAAYLPPEEVRLVCWANTVRRETLDMLRGLQKKFPNMKIIDSKENVPKYKVMRRLYHEEEPPQTPWILWFDDDTYITHADWWQKTKAFIQSTPDACYVGQRWYVHHYEGQWEFIKQSDWFLGRSPDMLPTKTKGVNRPGVKFLTGGYVWLRTDIMKKLDWPDKRLSHNGGDTLLGEAIRQHGLKWHHYHYGVAVNKARRRGISEAPAGAKNKKVRR